MKLKICGLRDTKNIRSLLALQPDYLGFIFYKKSKRYAPGVLDVQSFRELEYWKEVRKVGVFVNESIENILDILKTYGLNAVQLHGDESPDFCRKLRMPPSGGDGNSPPERGPEIIKVFSVDDDFDFNRTRSYEDVCDRFLFDTKGAERGGNGIAFNWEVLNKYKGEKSFFLSGGIGPDDLADILKIQHPKLYGVDINSRFETEPGLKDVALVKGFMEHLRC